MAKDIDAVIAALRVLLAEAERRNDGPWHISKVNVWIARLPGAWWGRWRHLKLRADYPGIGKATDESIITHLRTTLAYLENYHDEMRPRGLWPFIRRHDKPKDAKIIPLPGKKLLH
jgi:hypothetical protein